MPDSSHHVPIDKNAHIILVDGSGYIFRAFHALPPLTRKSDGLPIGAVAGFCNMLFKMLREQHDELCPTHFAVIFDASGKTFRHDIFPAYKANRGDPPEELIPQFPLTRRATRAFGVPAIELAGYEADDLIATYARQAEAQGARVTVISSDKDLMQLVSSHISLFDSMKNKTLGVAEVLTKFGVGPERVIDVQSLAGDSVDNIPGVSGIGIKTAALLINEFGNLDNLLDRAGEIQQQGRRQKLLDHAEEARLSRELVRLVTDIAVPVSLSECAIADPDPKELFSFLEEMEFRTLTARVRAALGEGEGEGLRKDSRQGFVPPGLQTEPNNVIFDHQAYECVQSLERLEHWIVRVHQAGVVAVDLETDSLDSAQARLVGVCLAVADNEACYIPLAHAQSGDLLKQGVPEQIPMETALACLKPMLEDISILKVGHNFKYDLGVLVRYDIYPRPYDDTMLISYALSCGQHGQGMDALSELHFGHRPIAFKEVAGTGQAARSFDQLSLAEATPYAAEDADVTLRLWGFLKPHLAAQGVASVYETLERGLPEVVAQMENYGIKIERSVLARLSRVFSQRMEDLQAKAHTMAGEAFNLGSPKQLGDILFNRMELAGGKKTKTGAWQTGAGVLETLAAEGAPLPQIVLDWRHYAKLKSTYTDALVEQINPHTGRVHTSLALASTSTGRISSSDPNLQNIPIRTEDGRAIRQAFIAEPGHMLVAADYSQIELRLLAHVADLSAMKQAFSDGVDIHALTASEMFGIPISEMDVMTRRRAKAINFGIIYGISAFGLSQNLGISRSEAGAYIAAYFEKFPGIRAYMEATKEIARQQGYVTTLFGRKCYIKGIGERNPAHRGFAERQAINAPIQGGAADIMRRAMLRMPVLLDDIDGARLLLQVHDELVFEVPEDKAAFLMKKVKVAMENAALPAVKLDVPLVVETKAAKNWNDAH